MAAFGMYCIRDIKTGFMDPVTLPSDEVAVEQFKLYVEKLITGEDDITEKFHVVASDLQLYKVGMFDISTGVVQSSLPNCLYSGSSIFIRKEMNSDEKSECEDQ